MAKDSKHFCMAPWVHLHAWPDGQVFACCMTPMDQAVGHIDETVRLKDIWNNKNMRELRQRMLADEKSPSCTRCYELEQAGSRSMRAMFNRKFAHYQTSVDKTTAEGEAPEMKLPYLDIRFSNICNFRCRSCGPQLSSSWYGDNKQLYPKSAGKSPIIRPTEDLEDFWSQIEPLLPDLEEIYFAGGEPLLMEEHYRILQFLIDNKMTNVRIRYNTNFSVLTYKKYDVITMWRQFENVRIGASLDAHNERGELMRKGQKWEKVIENRQRLMREVPHVHFYISATLSIMNAFDVVDFHNTWIEKGWIEPSDFFLNLLLEPTHYRLQVLPKPFKEKINALYESHIAFLKKEYGARANESIHSFQAAINFMNEQDRSDELPDFWKKTNKLDEIRSENFRETFPEFINL